MLARREDFDCGLLMFYSTTSHWVKPKLQQRALGTLLIIFWSAHINKIYSTVDGCSVLRIAGFVIIRGRSRLFGADMVDQMLVLHYCTK